jgi:uncharacterized repeat protein (TIGR01451 family)
LIGFYDYVNDGYLDQHSHGSHTASTAAGNWVTATMVFSTTSLDPEISGIAPHANIIAYDVCDFGGCPRSSSIAAVNQAVSDGVHVINFSIGGGPGNPWDDAEAQTFLAARTAGVFVATSAGNDGPGAATMGSPGNSPWMLTVGNATHNRQYMNALIDMMGDDEVTRRAQSDAVEPSGFKADVRAAPARMGRLASDVRAPDADVFYQGFEEDIFPPTGWTHIVSNTIGTWMTATAAYSGTYAATVPYDYDQDEWLVSTPFSITEGYLSFYSAGSIYWCRDTFDNCDLNVWIVVGPGVGDGDDIYVGTAEDDWLASWTWTESYYDLTALLPGEEVRLGFQYLADDGADLYLDHINLIDRIPPPPDMIGRGITSGYGPAPIVYAGDYPNPNDPGGDPAQCVEPYPAGTWTNGEIVVCDRGSGIGRVEKGINVYEGGAGGFVLANLAEDGESVVADGHALPAVHIGVSDGEALRAWLASGDVHTATISGFWTDYDPVNGDIMASGSSRGPNAPNTRAVSIIKPDIIAPGTSILAAYSDTPDLEELGTAPGYPPGGHPFGPMGGTSMASPHVAGAAALLMALHPTWSPAEIQSALMVTALGETPLKEDAETPADPFDMGAGRVDLTVAAEAGLVLDITEQEYLDANPGEGGDPSTLNLPSLGQEQCMRSCAWTREVSSTLDYAVTWTTSFTGPTGMTVTVTPVSFTLMPFATQVISIEADVGGLPTDGSWAFGELMLTTEVTPPVAHFPVAVLPSAGVLPALVEASTRRDAGSQLVEDLIAIDITDLTLTSYGLVGMDEETFSLYQINDDTMDFPDIFFQGGPGIYTTELGVPAGSVRLLADILDTTSPDLDMLVFLDTDDDGVPELADVDSDTSCQSAAGGPFESCDILNPAAGRWFVIVINYEESASPPDSVVLGTALVSADAGNMTFTGPPAVSQGTPFDLRLFWDEPDMAAGDAWYGAFSIGSEPGSPGDIGMIPVNIYRYDDDVTKYASAITAYPGDTITYTIEVLNNVTSQELTYWLTDTIPAGMTYVPGSAMASDGMVDVTGDTLTWSGTMAALAMGYAVSDNTTDPECDNGFGGYVDLELFAIYPGATLFGDGVSWTGFSGQNPIQFYGVDHIGMGGTDDGFAYFDDTTVAWPANTSLPDPADPNDIMAILWNDMEVVYDGTPGSVRGVSLATAGTEVSVMEYDDVEPAPAGSTMNRYDFEVLVYSTIDDTPGAYEMIFAYDNVVGSPISATVGVENVDGSRGSEYLYGDPAGVITDGLMICFNYQLLIGDPVEITYQATVDAGTWEQVLTNDVWHDTDDPGSMLDSASVDVTVAAAAEPTWDKMVYINDNMVGDIGSPISVVPTDTIEIVDQVQISFTQDISFTLMEEWDDSLELVGYELPAGSLSLLLPGTEVITSDNMLTWSVAGLPADWNYVITKTFQALEGDWTVDLLTETLTVEDVVMQPDPVVLTFTHPVEPPCDEVTGVTLSVDPGTLYVDTVVSFSADIMPDNATKPYSYTVDYDDGTTPVMGSSSDDPLALSHTYASSGTFDVMISVWNCDMTVEEAVSDTLQVDIEMAGYDVYLPLMAANYDGG